MQAHPTLACIWAGDPGGQRTLPCIPHHCHHLHLHFQYWGVDDGAVDSDDEEEEEEDGEIGDEKVKVMTMVMLAVVVTLSKPWEVPRNTDM